MPSGSEWIFQALACPADRAPLAREGDVLRCPRGHEFPIVHGVPVLLLERSDQTHPYSDLTLRTARTAPPAETGSRDEIGTGAVDAWVQDEIARTNGLLYSHLRGRLLRYPIPEIRLGPGDGKTLIDVGCNWGRWVLAAARLRYKAVGIDPSLEALMAGRRVAAQLGLDVAFVAADGRTLPFADRTFDVAHSYSVLQHFSKEDARTSLAEMARVTAIGGTVLVQMPNLLGIRQAYNRLRQLLRRENDVFRVRYWLPWELRRTFEDIVGPARIRVDGFFSLNPQSTDLDLLTPIGAGVVRTSDALRRLSERVRPLAWFADSLYVEAVSR